MLFVVRRLICALVVVVGGGLVFADCRVVVLCLLLFVVWRVLLAVR